MTSINAQTPPDGQGGQNVNAENRARRMARLAVAKIQSQAAEIEALKAENDRLRRDFDAGLIDYVVLKTESDRLREALKPFADEAETFHLMAPLGDGSVIAGTFVGPVVETRLCISHFRRARATLNSEAK